MADIALVILKRMAATGKEIVQICGPMSTGGLGSLEANMQRFRKAVDAAAENGILVFDQIPFQSAMIRIYDKDAPYDHNILEKFYRRVFESGYVRRTLFLSGWESSVGARWEHELAGKLEIPTDPYPEEWLS